MPAPLPLVPHRLPSLSIQRLSLRLALIAVSLGLAPFALSLSAAAEFGTEVTSRARVIIDNDFGGDPDGLFQLAHHLLSPSVEIRGIISSHLYPSGFYDAPGTAAHAAKVADELLQVMRTDTSIARVVGAETALIDSRTPIPSEGADLIVREAMRTDVKTPLYIVCGAGLTNIASAYLLEPKISERLILIWIGGPEYPGILPPPHASRVEYNLGIDRVAAQVVFNHSDLPLWQVPRNAYRLALVSYAELRQRFSTQGPLSRFLLGRLNHLGQQAKHALGETYVLGDSPLVLLTALQTPWEADPASSQYTLHRTPRITSEGTYENNTDGRVLRVYNTFDTRLMFEDLYAKVALFDEAARGSKD